MVNREWGGQGRKMGQRKFRLGAPSISSSHGREITLRPFLLKRLVIPAKAGMTSKKQNYSPAAALRRAASDTATSSAVVDQLLTEIRNTARPRQVEPLIHALPS